MIQPNFVAGYIVNNTAQEEPLYLLLRRSEDSYLPGIWQMVTGKLNQNEIASVAVQREILEETGIECLDIYNIDVTMFYDQTKNHIAFSANFCGFTDVLDEVEISDEHDKYQWHNFSTAYNLLAFPSQKETLTFVHNHYVINKPHSANALKTMVR